MKKIVTSKVEKLYIALDTDAQKQAVKFAEYFINQGKEVYFVDLQEKDPSEMGFENFTNLIQNTNPIDQYGLMEKKLQLLLLMLVNKPVWILDDPFNGLDKQSIEKITTLISKKAENKGIILLSSHQDIEINEHKTVNLK